MSEGTAQKPNVVFFMMDQLSAKWIEAGLAGACHLPNVRRLCERGTRFNNCFTNNPVCSPARATIFTGLSCRGHGVTENGIALDPRIPTFMHILSEHGWYTANFGKLHLQPHFTGPYHDYQPYGFDIVAEVNDLRAGQWLDWIEKEHSEHYEEALSMVWPLDIEGFRHYGVKDVNLLEKVRQANEKFPKQHPQHEGQPVTTIYTSPVPEGFTPTDWITSQAVDYLREQQPGQPFFAHISYVQPHDPFTPLPRSLADVAPERLPEPVPESWTQEPNHPKHFDFPGSHQGIPPYWRLARQYYFATLSHLDEQLGKVLDALESAGLDKNTYVVLLADHGELLYDHGFLTKHNRHYDACIRVPLIIAGPGVRAGAVCDEIVQLEDIMPTVLDWTGCPEPAPRVHPGYRVEEAYPSTLAGHSLAPLLAGEQPQNWRQAAYIEAYSYWRNVQAWHWARTVRTKDYRYTYYPDQGGEEMFDLRKDPDELVSVAHDPAYAAVRTALRDVLLDRVIMQDSPKGPLGRLFYHEHC